MGDDGARGMQQLHGQRACTIAQDKANGVVFGTPKAAIALGAVDEVMSVNQVAQANLAFDARGCARHRALDCGLSGV